jgi:5-methylcytosine-specific restriction enzyme A
MPVTEGQGNPVYTKEETILALDLLFRCDSRVPNTKDPRVVEVSHWLRTMPIHPVAIRNARFRNAHGVVMKMQNLLACGVEGGLRSSKMDRRVWEEHSSEPAIVRRIAQSIIDGATFLTSTKGTIEGGDNSEVFLEGAVLTKLHKRRERSRGYRSKVLKRERSAKGVVVCQCCGTAGPHSLDAKLRESMFDVHHLLPLSQTKMTKTRLRDLALLCGNCHKLIHAVSRRVDEAVGIPDLQRRMGI